MQFQESFRAMDTDVDLIVEATTRPLDAFLSVRLLFEDQEQRFSRFREGSLLSRLNRGEVVEDERFAAGVLLALAAFAETDGLYNPLVLPALRAAGYDRTFARVDGGMPTAQAVPSPVACLAVDGNRVRLTTGGLDLGGVVKGWTVDLFVEGFAARYPALFLNAGGDLRCSGSEEGVDGWLVAVDPPEGEAPVWEGAMHGAVATSSRRRRRWRTAAGGTAHHLIDPRTGLPATGDYEQVTVWGEAAWRAEVWAKAVLIGGRETLAAAARKGMRVLAVCVDGSVEAGDEKD
ncbi:MAG: FAD:protein FMN transferase [Dehalococcoidia bacterium]|nr:FAD:protein FMN transferase [Dehalococcoidia bacterium]